MFASLYETLRSDARALLAGEHDARTLESSALVHEAYLKLRRHDGPWTSPRAFLSAASRAMRHVLVDHARRRKRRRRTSKGARTPLDSAVIAFDERTVEFLAFDEALSRFARAYPRAAQIVELHGFGWVSLDATARLLGVSRRTVESDWRWARIWLHAALDDGPPRRRRTS